MGSQGERSGSDRQAIRWRVPGVILLVVAAGIGAVVWSRRAKPNVVFILVDTLRADRVAAYNPYSSARTPVMSQLAREGVLYERAYAPSSWTLPSVASLFLGQRPFEHQVLQFLVALPAGTRTLAEVLADHG